jgi:hypothetical protein
VNNGSGFFLSRIATLQTTLQIRRQALRALLLASAVGVHLVLTALFEAALLIAHAVDRGAARAAAQEGVRLLLSGLLLQPREVRAAEKP